MKIRNVFILCGLAVYAILTVTDRFLISIPNAFYIPVAIVGIVLILFGAFKEKFDGKTKIEKR